MFLVQFKVESLQDKIVRVKTEISTYEDEIQLLEVEWVYLTRPQRLRTLASRYLENNNYTLANQIKNSSQLEEYYFASYKKLEEQPVSLAENQNKSKQISF